MVLKISLVLIMAFPLDAVHGIENLFPLEVQFHAKALCGLLQIRLQAGEGIPLANLNEHDHRKNRPLHDRLADIQNIGAMAVEHGR